MKKTTVSAKEIKDSIEALKGKLLAIKINKGRKKYVRYKGEVEEVMPSLFTLKIIGEKNLSQLACSYSEVICGDVILSVDK